jgi:hypothetical protein
MNNYIELILNYIHDFLEWSNNLYFKQDNIFGIKPDEDTLEDY